VSALWQVLVVVRLVGVGEVTLEARLADSTLELPAAEMYALLGLGTPPGPGVRLDALQRMYPVVNFVWTPREMLLTVEDPQAVLPASRAAIDRLGRQGRGAPGLTVTRSGPFAAFTADDRGRQMFDAGYSYKGRVAIQASRQRQGTTWGVSLAPLPAVYVSYTQGTQQAASVTSRLALGPAWLSTSWADGQRLTIDALLALGPLALFVSSRQRYAITIRGPVAVQVGRTGSTTTGRVSIGPVPPNPFSVPFIP
jgi:hypothetical protein